MRRLLLPMLIAALVAGCGSDDDDDQRATAPEPAAKETTTAKEPEPEPKKGTTIKLAGSQFGRILFDGRGQAIYKFDKEKSDRPDCYDECAAAWPPVLTDGEPQAAAGVDKGLLGTTKRRDGKVQVTYDGQPLYFYAHEARNEVKCHNVNEFGGLWLVLNGEGKVPS